eukprot:11244250-Prorocentrum_lima.AAC.1
MWQAQNDRPYLAYNPGAGVADIVYRQGFQAELAASANHAYGIVLWDLKQYYEHIDRKLLEKR